MGDVLSITGTIFVVIGVGFLSVRLRLFAPSDLAILGRFVVNFALPALILTAISSQPIGEFFNAGYLLAVLIGSLAVFWGGYAWVRHSGGSAAASTFGGMGMSCANSGFVGFPILLIALPDVASLALALNMIVENLVMIPLVLILAERSREGDGGGIRLAAQIAARLCRNPIVIALLLGLLIAASGYAMPAVVARPIELFAAASAAISLTVIGGTLATLPLRSLQSSVFTIAFGKLVAHPVAIGLSLVGMSFLGFRVEDERLVAAAIILASTPVMAIYPILAQTYGEERIASLAMFVMTVASFATMSLVLTILPGRG